MIDRPRATATLLVALLLGVAAPTAALVPATATGSAMTTLATPLNKNLLFNGGFNRTPTTGHPVPGWTVEGDMHVETFGTRTWPYPAYGRKYDGGARYLACGKHSGLVRQTVDVTGWSAPRDFKLRARLWLQFGGVIGHKIRVSVRAIGGDPAYAEKPKTMDVTHHYKESVATINVPVNAERLEVEIELTRKSGASSCKMMADSPKLTLFTV